MKRFLELFDLANGPVEGEADTAHTRRMELVVRASLASVVFAALYGFAAGSTDLGLALGNLYKVPMVLVLSAACAAPAALITWKLSGAQNRPSDLLLGIASGNFTASVVLAALSPIVALYYHTSDTTGGTLALAAAALATFLGFRNVVRAVMKRRPEGSPRGSVALPLTVLVAVQMAALIQFIHVASPILPEVTLLDGGVDSMVGR